MIKIFLRMMFCVAVSALCVGSAAAQNSYIFRRGLAEPDGSAGSRAIVTENGTASDVLARYNNANIRKQSIPGYRVRIFFSNSQTAREDAMAIREQFRTQFPSIPTYLDYETPSWIVTVGNCMNIDEFLILLGRVNRYYPSAFQWRGDIPINEFLRGGDMTGVAGDDAGDDIDNM